MPVSGSCSSGGRGAERRLGYGSRAVRYRKLGQAKVGGQSGGAKRYRNLREPGVGWFCLIRQKPGKSGMGCCEAAKS